MTAHQTATSAYARVQKIDMDLHDAIGMTDVEGPLRKFLEAMHSDVHDLAVDVAALRDEREVPGLVDDDVEWVVNDLAELGVKIKERFFFCYKGESLAYVSPKHDESDAPIKWRRVFKREFGECIHPINHEDYSRIGTVSLDDSKEWRDLPSMPEHVSSSYRLRAQIATTTKDRTDGQ